MGCAEPARLEPGFGVPALGVPEEGTREDCLSDEVVVCMVPLSEVFKQRRFDASALLSRWDLADGLLRCAWLRRAF